VVKPLTASVLGFLILTILVSGCSILDSQPREIQVSTTAVERPQLVLPRADELRLRGIEWILITPDNIDEVFDRAKEAGRPIVFFALTDKGYEDLGLNISDIRAYIQQQNTIIAAYKDYYEQTQETSD